MKIGFIGLGNMGYPMAGHLVKNNYELMAYNRSQDKLKKWGAENNAPIAQNYQELIERSDVLILCVGNDHDVRTIVRSDWGVLNRMKPGSVVIDHTTTSAFLAQEISGLLKSKNISFLDCPVSGGQIGAENGQLTIMAGGDEEAFSKVSPILNCYSKKLSYMGVSGNGQLTKMVNQICLAGVIQGLSEGINFAINSGLDADKAVEVISHGAAGSWQMNHRSSTMIADKFDFGFAIKLMRKDLNICLSEARQNASSLPITSLIDQFYAQLENMGFANCDTSALIKLLKQE
jgi:3-hydroxyisobutyrate dehydrogenase-like beta-hydroxyacid dehydrogenase